MAGRMGERLTLDEVAARYRPPLPPGQDLPTPHRRVAPPLPDAAEAAGGAGTAAGGEEDLTSLALDLGFSSHSHLTDAFRKEFGNPPSAMRKAMLSKSLREMSKNLEA